QIGAAAVGHRLGQVIRSRVTAVDGGRAGLQTEIVVGTMIAVGVADNSVRAGRIHEARVQADAMTVESQLQVPVELAREALAFPEAENPAPRRIQIVVVALEAD